MIFSLWLMLSMRGRKKFKRFFVIFWICSEPVPFLANCCMRNTYYMLIKILSALERYFRAHQAGTGMYTVFIGMLRMKLSFCVQ